MTRAELLQQHVDAVAGKPVEWGADDCTAWAADWVLKATGRKVPFLARYKSREEAHAAIATAGGLSVLWRKALERASIYETVAPDLGDIGIIKTSRYGEVGVIFALDGIALWRADSGTVALRPRRSTIVCAFALPE